MVVFNYNGLGLIKQDTTKQLNVYGSIIATSNISCTCNIITNNILNMAREKIKRNFKRNRPSG